MFGWIRRLFYGRQLSDIVSATKIVKVHGVRFTIKKLDPTCFLDGSKVMLQTFDTYKVTHKDQNTAEITQGFLDKIKSHYVDVFCSGVESPVLVRKKEDAKDGAIYVEHLFTDWSLAHDLYQEVVGFTYGKKKFKLSS